MHNSFAMLLILSVFLIFGSLVSCTLNIYLEKKALINGLDGIINFLNYDSENVNADCLLGIVISEAQLNMILEKLTDKSQFYEIISELKNKSLNLTQKIKTKIQINSDMDYYRLFENIIKPELWQINKPFINNSLSKLNIYDWNKLPEEVLLDNILFNGHPNEQESDKCISELLTQGNIEKFHQCNPSNTCKKIMLNINGSNGYPLTHKLLYWQIAKAWKCIINTDIFNNILNSICSKILQEFRNIDTIQNNIKLRDLYMEQMVLCGLEGYQEFLNSNSRKNLLDWLFYKDAYNCYSNRFIIQTKRWRDKRNTSEMKFGCESHITGVGIAAISLNLRYLFTVI